MWVQVKIIPKKDKEFVSFILGYEELGVMNSKKICSNENQYPRREYSFLGYIPVIVSLISVLLFVLNSRKRTLKQQVIRNNNKAPNVIVLPDQPNLVSTSPDDLTLIHGIGEKVAVTLNKAGIYRFSQLAQFHPGELKIILSDAGNRISDPESWPQQASYAAAQQWDGLNKLKAKIRSDRTNYRD